MSSESFPLRGVRVIELCQIAAGPFAGMLLADMGADVIKVESPEGDGMRNWPPHTGGYSENFASLNRNKRSVVFDLKNPIENETAKRLCLSAEIVLGRACEGFGREDLLKDERFGSTALRAKNQGALKELLEAAFATLTAGECLDRMRSKGVPCAPIRPPRLGEHTAQVLKELDA